MSPADKYLITESFARIQSISGPLSLLFYGRLFELDPSLRSMFRQDAAVQGRKLIDMLAAVVQGLDNVEALAPLLRSLGQRHTGYGVRPEHYETVTAALIWALAQALEPDFSSDVRTAWLRVIELISRYMKEGAAQVPQHWAEAPHG